MRINRRTHPEIYGSKGEDSEVSFCPAYATVLPAEPIPNLDGEKVSISLLEPKL
jgi:hypothetical protein